MQNVDHAPAIDVEAVTVAAIIAENAHLLGPLLPVLNAVQAELGCVSEAAQQQVAHGLNLSRAEVHGVVSFYDDLRETQAPHPVIRLCRAEACQARGVEALLPAALEAARGRAEIETVHCLGLCAVGPAALANGRVHGRLDAASLLRLIEET